MNHKIFNNLDLESSEMEAIILHELEKPKLSLGIKWTAQKRLLVPQLEVKQGQGLWRSLIQQTRKDYDGEMHFDLGWYSPGEKIKLRFTLYSLDNIPKAALFIYQKNPNAVRKVVPERGSNKLTISLKKNTDFFKKLIYTVVSSTQA